MRLSILSLTLVALVALTACTSTDQRAANQTTTTSTNTSTMTNHTSVPPTQTSNTASGSNGLPVAPAHGDAAAAPPSASNPSSANTSPDRNEQAGIDTAALDAKIEKAEAKAKAKSATQGDKLAAAAAYLERANIFMNAGRPALYKYALRDYRRTLRYQPDNQQAKESAATIVSIYQSMGRPVPELGNEP
jgi:hypothetical protein